MSDDKTDADESDRRSVAREDDGELQYLASKHKITIEQAQDLIRKHGDNRAALDEAAARLRSTRRASLSARRRPQQPENRSSASKVNALTSRRNQSAAMAFSGAIWRLNDASGVYGLRVGGPLACAMGSDEPPDLR